jgi:hypothetical protein
MRGAVLHGLFVSAVKEGVMRRSYGLVTAPVFRVGIHHADRRYIDFSGVARCRDVMDWIALRVSDFIGSTDA